MKILRNIVAITATCLTLLTGSQGFAADIVAREGSSISYSAPSTPLETKTFSGYYEDIDQSTGDTYNVHFTGDVEIYADSFALAFDKDSDGDTDTLVVTMPYYNTSGDYFATFGGDSGSRLYHVDSTNTFANFLGLIQSNGYYGVSDINGHSMSFYFTDCNYPAGSAYCGPVTTYHFMVFFD